MTSLNFIYFGRLTQEKGFTLFLELAKTSINQNLGHNFYIFGSGPLEQKIYSIIKTQQLVDLKTKSNTQILNYKPTQNQIIFGGKQDYPKTIKPILETKIDYTIIPSKLIETFGYTALESLKQGVPILTTAKGGLAQFTSKKHIFTYNLNSLISLIKKLNKPTSQEKQKAKNISKNFSSNNWITQLSPILKNKQKILLISDFKNPIGGTEKHIQDIAKILTQHNCIVKIFTGTNQPSKLNLLQAIHNRSANQKLKKELETFKPDLIWCHSIMRFLGPLCLKTINQTNAKKIITIHDLGLFTSYPSKTKSTKEITTQSKKLTHKIKYLLLQKPIQTQIKNFNHIFVPSEFLQQPIQKVLNKKIEILPHFISDND